MAFSTPPAPPRSDDFERLLFESARHDVVPEVSRQRVAAALGIVPMAAAEAAMEPRVEANAARGGTSEAASGSQGALQLLGKPLMVGLAGGALAIGAALYSGAPVPAVATLPAAVNPTLAVPSAPAAALAPAPAPEVSPRALNPTAELNPMAEAADAEAAPAASARPTPRAIRERTGSATAHSRHQREASVRQVEPPTARDAAASSRLLAEVRQLDATRNALALGRSDDALRELRRYAEEFPRGTLALDAALLEVRALQRSGRRAMAQRRAHQLLSQPGAERHRAELEAMINPLASGYKTRRRDIEEAR